MATEIAGILSEESEWGFSGALKMARVFEIMEIKEDGQEREPETGNGNLFRLEAGANWKMGDGIKGFTGSSSLRFGVAGSYVDFPKMPDGRGSKRGGDTRVGGFLELDAAFPGEYGGFFSDTYYPGKAGFRAGLMHDLFSGWSARGKSPDRKLYGPRFRNTLFQFQSVPRLSDDCG